MTPVPHHRPGVVAVGRRIAVLAALVAVLLIAPVAAHGAEPAASTTTTIVSSSDTPSTVANDTPSPRGEPAPPTTQRIADSAIAVGLLVVLVGGVVVGVVANRRRNGQR